MAGSFEHLRKIKLKAPGLAPVRFGYGSGVERFERFRFSVPAVSLQKKVFVCFSTV